MNNESYDFEDRKYVNPTLSRDEQLAFVDNLRSVQQNDMAKIVQDTHNLGTDLPSNEGGLTGSEGIWNAEYVDPKVNEMVTSLKSAAQAQALNNILTNHQNQWQQRYNEAYRAAEKRKDALENSGSGGSSDDDDEEDDDKPAYVANDTGSNNSSSNKEKENSFWKDGTYNDKEAFYGLYRLKRNEGESDDAWFKRAKDWISQQSAAYNLKNGKLPTTKPKTQHEQDKENGTVTPSGNPFIDSMRFFM